MAYFYKSKLTECENYNDFKEIIGGMWYYTHTIKKDGYHDVREYSKVFKGFDYISYYIPFRECSFFRNVCCHEIIDFTCPKFDTKTKTVTFFESSEKREKQIRSNPTKMGKFFRKIAPYFNDKQIEFLVDYVVEYFFENDYTPHVAKGKDITKIYLSKAEKGRYLDNYSCLNASCMRYDDWTIHPTEVYATESWELHYLTNENGDIAARALVCKEDDVYSYIYASCEQAGDALREKLEELEFTDVEEASQPFDGAKLLKIEGNGGLVAPYIDYHTCVKDCGDYLELTYGYADYDFCSTGGYVEYVIHRDCAECGCSYDEEDMISIDGELYCEDCTFYCEHFGRSVVGEPVFVYQSTYYHMTVCEDALEDMGAVYNDDVDEWQTKEWYEECTKEDEEETEDEIQPKKEIAPGVKCIVISNDKNFHFYHIGTVVDTICQRETGNWLCVSNDSKLEQVVEEKDLVVVE